MKKFSFAMLIIICVGTDASADNWSLGTSCAYNRSGSSAGNPCAYCLGDGASAPGNCTPSYASCANKPVLQISVNSSLGNVECTSSGWCYSSCSDSRNPDGSRSNWVDYSGHPNMEVWEEKSGCTCSNSKLDTTRTRCKSGYEMVEDECLAACPTGWKRRGKKCLETCTLGYYSGEDGTCVACPSLMSVSQDEDGQWQNAGLKYATGAGTGATVSQCYLNGNSPDLYFSDETGVWQITVCKRCYHD